MTWMNNPLGRVRRGRERKGETQRERVGGTWRERERETEREREAHREKGQRERDPHQPQNSTLLFSEFCTLVELLSDTVLFLNLHFLKEIYATFGKIYTNLHKVGAGCQKHCKHP